MPSEIVQKFMRVERLPHIWCRGCGNGVITHDVLLAIDSLCKREKDPLKTENIVVVSGIGCSSRASGYLNFNTIHTTHGRAIAFATGIKAARPELTVIVLTGDGDCAAIGGNHLIHACRRNIDITVIVYNNNIYGMTGGQYSPTTPQGDYASTAIYGVIDRPFDIVTLAAGAGAGYADRGDVYHALETTDLIRRGIEHKGFSLIDCYSICPTYYGRKNGKGRALEMLMWQKENGMSKEGYAQLGQDKQEGKYICGVITEHIFPEYTEQYRKIIERAQADMRERDGERI